MLDHDLPAGASNNRPFLGLQARSLPGARTSRTGGPSPQVHYIDFNSGNSRFHRSSQFGYGDPRHRTATSSPASPSLVDGLPLGQFEV